MSASKRIHRCDAHFNGSGIQRCWHTATHQELCGGGVDYSYYCEHHAQLRKRQGGSVTPLHSLSETAAELRSIRREQPPASLTEAQEQAQRVMAVARKRSRI